MTQIYAYIPFANGTAEDVALEYPSAAKKIDAGATLTAVVAGTGADLDKVANAMTAVYKEVIKIDNAAMAYPNAEIVRKALVSVLPADAIVLAPHNTFGMDLAPGLSIKMNSAYAADIVDIEGIEGSSLKLIRQELGGAVSTHVTTDISAGAVITIRPGAFAPVEGGSAGGSVTDKSADAGDLSAKRKFLEVVEAEVGDVDITKSDVLVSIGRGIEEEENIAIAQELADAMKAVVSCSRPIVDAKWLEKSRQVGTSGQTVKPKVYMAMGISGSFQHLGGIKGNPFIVAVNKNPKAPIFQVADVGIVENILEFMPALTEAINEL
ncbi:MAG: electron transfer flavoprotein subunit alpha/FixB family protein [Proteobacteria bacterium]|nr:electron transfer flavoprotein subunit alpha/FixB family protein [Pseudomonadota bacterium]MBU1387368.1 electron transfer flavoprotein subunit alpha/FixB family protein [Pseudomonadota bacterium]MBU1541653.1 electron transfer flavoprotein subunit alpha/FixB family protein [Pseudomonadota bacterium]MBU2430646.1 electron transfer flavoprotein subunit alpha/FixB family protein [Pseudomonadota bacterium]MBU2482119.1 electron transfer flavoprotein subunit alpha/FixB family protein [Pseudomonadota